MKKHAIIFSLYHYSTSGGEFITFLHNCLTTLFNVIDSNPSFDVVAFLKSNDDTFSFDFEHLNQFNIVKDFPNLKIVNSDYPYSDAYMSKWYHFQKAFQMGYEKVFYFDCDIIFFKNPDFLFEKYKDDYFWCLYADINPYTKAILGYPGISSGQFLMSKTLFNKIPDFFNTLTKKRVELTNKANKYFEEGLISASDRNSFNYFNEQYCAQEVFHDFKIPIKEIDRYDMNWGYDIVPVIRDKEDDVIGYGDNHYTMWHYTSFHSYLILPKKYFTPYLEKKYINSKKQV